MAEQKLNIDLVWKSANFTNSCELGENSYTGAIEGFSGSFNSSGSWKLLMILNNFERSFEIEL